MKVNGVLSFYRTVQIHDLYFRLSKWTSPRRSLAHKHVRDGHNDVTTGVSTWYLIGTDDLQAKENDKVGDTSLSEIVKSCLGGHDDGVSVVDDGDKNA